MQTGHDIKKNIPGTDEHALHNPTRGTGAEGVKNAAKVRLEPDALCMEDKAMSLPCLSVCNRQYGLTPHELWTNSICRNILAGCHVQPVTGVHCLMVHAALPVELI